MTSYRNQLPQLGNQVFISDGGLETTLIFHDGLDLPEFAAFTLLAEQEGRQTLETYFDRYATIARGKGLGFIYESPTWRASADWAQKLALSEAQLADLNKRAIELGVQLRDRINYDATPVVISGCVGPRGDGYVVDQKMSAIAAEHYHAQQISMLKQAGADMVSAITMNYVEEAIGITRAALAEKIPVVISFTVETDGRLPSGQALKDAILAVDAATDNGPAYYMINCAHPSHFDHVLETDACWVQRIRGIRANASCKSHAELDEATELDDGNPQEFGALYREILDRLHVNVLGGCCGTDHRHVQAVCEHCL